METLEKDPLEKKREKLKEFKKKYIPKNGYTLQTKVSDITGKYLCFVWQTVVVSRTKKENADINTKTCSTDNFEEFTNFLIPYLRERDGQNDTREA